MSRRDSVIKGIAAALQPDSLDLTQYAPARSVSAESAGHDREVRVRGEMAAGALAFTGMPWKEDPLDHDDDAIPGNPLFAALLRLKYAEHRGNAAWQGTLELLLREHWDRKRASTLMEACARAALFEWVHDACPDCRGKKTPIGRTCRQCVRGYVESGGLRRSFRYPRTATEEALMLGALHGEVWVTRHTVCGKCNGRYLLPMKEREGKGLKCTKCWNSGRVTFRMSQRWALVSEYVVAREKREIQEWKRRHRAGARGEPKVQGLDFKVFASRWHTKYCRFIDILRKADKDLAGPIDIQLYRLQNADTVRRLEEEDMPSDESYVSVGQVSQGGLPPKDS